MRKKGGLATDPGGNRPIALLPCLGKVFEVALRDRKVDYCEDMNVLPADQFGFCRGLGTSHALNVLLTDISIMLNVRKPTLACTLDIEKAFDTVWFEGLVYKMRVIFGFNDNMCAMIYNYLIGRTFVVNIADHLSAPHPVIAGVPQGGVLSATLFIIYMADIPDPPVERQQIKRLQYADDMIIYLSTSNVLCGQNRLNNYLKTLFNYYHK